MVEMRARDEYSVDRRKNKPTKQEKLQLCAVCVRADGERKGKLNSKIE